MPTLFARRYARPVRAVSGTEKAVGGLILVLVVGLIATLVIHVARDRERLFDVPSPDSGEPGLDGSAGVASLLPDSALPDSGIPDWQPPRRVERFTPGNLYVKIDGQAEAYLKLGCVGLTFGTYAHATDAGRAIDVYWYDMGTQQNALRAYQAEAPRDVPPVSVGDGGYQAGSAVFFRKGANYVQVMPTQPGDADAEVARKIAERLAAGI
jgi:hypothetical protein